MTLTAHHSPPGHALRVGMVLYSALTFDSRVQREANALAAAGHHVTIFCLDGLARDGTDARPPCPPQRPAKGRAALVARQGQSLRDGQRRGSPHRATPVPRDLCAEPADVGTRHRASIGRIRCLACPRLHRTRCRLDGATARRSLVYDMHDLFLDTGAGTRLPTLGRTLLLWYERRLARRADLLVTVNQGLAGWARSNLRPRSIAVVHNCVPRTPPTEPRPTRIGDALGLAGVRVVLYHGMLGGNRGLDELYEAMLRPGLDGTHLVLLGFGPDRDRLRAMADETRFGGRIHLLEPVPPGELVAWVASADVGVMPNQPRTLNERLSTPNKLFESLAAGLPVISSDFPERRRIIMHDPLGPLGAVCDPARPVAIADAIRSVLDLDVAAYDDLRRRCSEAAKLRWNWEHEAATLVDAYRRIARARAARAVA